MKLAMIFPGQGSQAVGMMQDLADAYPQVGETFAEASAVLGYDLWTLTQGGPAASLNETDKTQPAMLAAGVAAYRVWHARGGPRPEVMAGHSLGEYSALVCATALEFPVAVALVAERGRLMQNAVPAGAGAMAAILGLDDDVVKRLCAEQAQDQVVAAVNFNSPGQVVVAGQADAVSRVMTAAKLAGAKRALPLPVSVPSHCALMQSAAEQLAARLRETEIRAPEVPVLHNADVASYDNPQMIRDALARQLYSPVRWVETVRMMAGRGVTNLVECGPGKVLTGLAKRIEADLRLGSVHDVAGLDAALTALQG
jgi:[acyl-carrier-protein] S-malonyltransferase